MSLHPLATTARATPRTEIGLRFLRGVLFAALRISLTGIQRAKKTRVSAEVLTGFS